MEELIKKYENKLVLQGLCNRGDPVIGGLDVDITWNRDAEEIDILEKIINGMNINSILFSKPAEPYFSILNYLALHTENDQSIHPQDCETRTFLHDIPVCYEFNAEHIIGYLKKRKSVIIPNYGIVTYGIISPEQAFVTYSSVCFSGYVKFFTDYYYSIKNNSSNYEQKSIISNAVNSYGAFINSINKEPENRGPFNNNKDVINAIIEAGRMTVESRMVDSFFGNISYKFNDTIFISQTGSSLDELEGYIDPCPIDGTSTTAITASSEFSAHKSIYNLWDNMSILHGHPKFSVIMSMLCDDYSCINRDKCFIKCSKERYINDIPIIPGEVGTGPTGLCNTLPAALKGRGAIVYGHGLFTVGKVDFIDAYKNLVDVEKFCFEEYKKVACNFS